MIPEEGNMNMEIQHWYPFIFSPIYKERIWGGNRISSYFQRQIPEGAIGESWELSTIPGDESRIVNGCFASRRFDEVIRQYPIEVLGRDAYNRFGSEFPLLLKFIDAKLDLSIQLHPGDELAKARHNSFGKTEMWYVMNSDENARLITGFKSVIDKEEFKKHMFDESILNLLQEEKVNAGDVFYIPTGTIHAIGAGVLLAEIQQTSDVTYRIFDWNRVDSQGNSRELHLSEALDAINFDNSQAKISYTISDNKSEKLVHSPYFKTNILKISGALTVNSSDDLFRVYMCVDGNVVLSEKEQIIELNLGQTVFMPAILSEWTLQGEGTLLEVSI